MAHTDAGLAGSSICHLRGEGYRATLEFNARQLSVLGRFLRPPVVLAYHAVGDVEDADDPHRLVLSPARLEGQLAMLRRRGYRFVTAADLAASGAEAAPGTAVLTFDDGWLDALTDVVPLLQKV